jgi:hypothetical protein
LTAKQLERLVAGAGLSIRSEDPDETPAPFTPEPTPGYFAPPVYGQGPIKRSTGYQPPPLDITDVRHPNTVIDLTEDEALVRVTTTGQTAPAPRQPQPPSYRGPEPAPAAPHETRTVELAITFCLVVALIVLAIVFLL